MKLPWGVSNTYYAAKNWMTGQYNFTNDEPPQPFIPIVAYWDDDNKVPWALPHVYDYMEGQDAVAYTSPQMGDSYNGRRYLTAYAKQQKASFGAITVDRSGGTPDSTEGLVSTSGSCITLGDGGSASYAFQVPEGNYDIAVRLCYPFWDINSVYIALDSEQIHLEEKRLWWPYWRTPFWTALASGKALSAGTHTITVSVGAKGVQFYGFRVCSAFSTEHSAGNAVFSLAPRQFKDVNGSMTEPDRGFKLTCEMLRRKADSALIWYEDFRDANPLPVSYWTTLSGEWDVWKSSYTESRSYSQLDGSGQLAWKYTGFRDIHLRARLAFPADGTGRAGVFCGTLFCCLNVTTQALELYNGDTQISSYSMAVDRTAEDSLRDSPRMYTLEMRIRGSTVRVYAGASSALRFLAQVEDFSGGYAGYRSDSRTVCELLRLGESWVYEPYECFDVTFPDGTTTKYGRIQRDNVSWDEEFQVFTLASDMEEIATRSESIPLEYDFFHSHLLPLSCGEDYTVTITPQDINVWISRLFLGDADGFSILYYQDVDSLVYWSNQAAYRWKLRGMCLWSLGQEDMRLWEYLPKQI